jgi:hypothetical protein
MALLPPRAKNCNIKRPTLWADDRLSGGDDPAGNIFDWERDDENVIGEMEW